MTKKPTWREEARTGLDARAGCCGRAALVAGLVLINAVMAGLSRSDTLVVIAPEVFQEALQPLILHKNSTGVMAELVTLESIEADYVGVGHDAAERVKLFLADAYEPPRSVRYALLVGDADLFPIRWVPRYLSNEQSRIQYYFPSDLYYADLFDAEGRFQSWDYNGNGIFGEFGQHVDMVSDPYKANRDRMTYRPDIAVGRIPAHTVEEVRRYVVKVIRYEYLMRTPAGQEALSNFLFIAGDGRANDPPIHLFDIAEGSPLNFRSYVQMKYYDADDEQPERPAEQLPGESLADAMQRTGLSAQHLAWMAEVPRWIRSECIPDEAFEDLGFYFWYDHSHWRTIYNRFDDTALYPVTYSSGCSDGGFAGWEPGYPNRFFEQGLPYRTTAGHTISIGMESRRVGTGDNAKDILIALNTCVIDGVQQPLSALMALYPALEVYCDTGENGLPIRDKHAPYFVNMPMPAVLQPADCVPRVVWVPEAMLLQKTDPLGRPTGWIGMIGATKGTSFPGNGELASLFFRSLHDLHPALPETMGLPRLGDMWRSMLHHWIDTFYDSQGRFSLWDYLAKYRMEAWRFRGTGTGAGIEDTIQTALFGDPSLRVGGVVGISDTLPPTTTADVPGPPDWINRLTVTLHAEDLGAPPSGVWVTYHRIGGVGGFATGTEVLFPSDGVHSLQFQSKDLLDNLEELVTQEVRIERVPPVSAVDFNGTSSDITLPDATDDPPWFDEPLDIYLEAVDPGPHVSGVRRIWYRIRGGAGLPYGAYQEYEGPIRVNGGELASTRHLDFFAEDWAGNFEEVRTQPFRVQGRRRVGRFLEESLIQSAWKDIANMRLTDRLIDKLPPINHVVWDYRLPGSGQWDTIGVSYSGESGWDVKWFTHLIPDGTYRVRTRVYGMPPPGGMVTLADELLHEEEIEVEVCNLLPSARTFELEAPAGASPEQTIEYEIDVENLTAAPWTDVELRCLVDLGAVTDIEVLDGGGLDVEEGMPLWNFEELVPGKLQTVRFRATVAAALPPGYVIRAQAQLRAAGGVFLLSRNPALPGHETSTDVTLPWVNGRLTGTVHSDDGLALVCDMLLVGPETRTTQSEPTTGAFEFDGLPRGTYTLQVLAGPAYRDPRAPRSVELTGMGDTVHQTVVLDYRDITPPLVWIVTDDLRLPDGPGFGTLAGQADDPGPGSGVLRVEVMVRRDSDGLYWSGTSWVPGPMWRTAAGTTEWSLDCSMLPPADEYRLRVRAWDVEGNVSQSVHFRTHADVGRPELVWPGDGATISLPGRLAWTAVHECEYVVQISTQPDFPSLVRSASHVLDCDVPIGSLPDGLYYWRVKGVNHRHGTPVSPWSDVRSFTVQSSFRITGIERHPVTGATTVRWQGPADALYWVQEADDLLPGSAFRYRSGAIPGQTGENEYNVPAPTADGAFFRVLGY